MLCPQVPAGERLAELQALLVEVKGKALAVEVCGDGFLMVRRACLAACQHAVLSVCCLSVCVVFYWAWADTCATVGISRRIVVWGREVADQH